VIGQFFGHFLEIFNREKLARRPFVDDNLASQQLKP
jgi:hypothetical protein